MEYFKLGKFVSIHGLKGELLLKHNLGKKSSFKNLRAIFTEEPNGSFLPWFIQDTRIKSADETFIKLEGVDSREAAKRFSQKPAWIPEPDFKKYATKSAPASMLGYLLVDRNVPVGKVEEVIEQPHQLLVKINVSSKEALIPLHEDFLKKIDHRKKEIHVSLPEGLIEIYLE